MGINGPSEWSLEAQAAVAALSAVAEHVLQRTPDFSLQVANQRSAMPELFKSVSFE